MLIVDAAMMARHGQKHASRYVSRPGVQHARADVIERASSSGDDEGESY